MTRTSKLCGRRGRHLHVSHMEGTPNVAGRSGGRQAAVKGVLHGKSIRRNNDEAETGTDVVLLNPLFLFSFRCFSNIIQILSLRPFSSSNRH